MPGQERRWSWWGGLLWNFHNKRAKHFVTAIVPVLVVVVVKLTNYLATLPPSLLHLSSPALSQQHEALFNLVFGAFFSHISFCLSLHMHMYVNVCVCVCFVHKKNF